jgi:hypothetical protein
VPTSGQITRVSPRPCGCGCDGNLYSSLARAVSEFSRVGQELVRGLLSGESYNPRKVGLNAVRIGAASAEGMAALVGGLIDPARLLELSNKLTAYRLFASADRLLRETGCLASALRHIGSLDSYSRLWITEGFGWYSVKCGQVRRLDPALQCQSLIPLHTGAGLALAHSALESHRRGAGTVLDTFRRACAEMSVPGYEGACFEALGLVTITLYPQLARNIEAELAGPEETAYFWHGVGRGLYFCPLSFVPVPAARRWLVEGSQCLPAGPAGRENILAGLAWATTLLNIRNPEVLACSIRDLDKLAAPGDSFGNGIASAIMVWRESNTDDRCLERWRRQTPRAPTRLWDRCVTQSLRDIQRCYISVRTHAQWGSLFRVHNFEQWEQL